MKNISIDIETFSDVDLQKCGVYKYAQSENFEILLFGYSVDGGEVVVIDIAQGGKIPDEIIAALTDEQITKWAFNANFERVCLSEYLRKFYPEKFVSYSIREDSVSDMKKVLSEVLGIDEFDEEVFLEKIDFINVPKQYTLEIHFKDGDVITKPCRNTGHKDCWTKEYREKVSVQRRKKNTNPKGASVFTSKLKCRHCGCNYRRCTQPSATSKDGKFYYWRCAEKNDCNAKGLREDFLKPQLAEALGMEEWNDESFAEKVEHIDIYGYMLDIVGKDGSVTSMNFKPPERGGIHCSEKQKEHMRKLMKERWTPELKQQMSDYMKKLRKERGEAWRKEK